MNELKILISNSALVLNYYDKELKKSAIRNKGLYDVSDENLHKVCNDVFSMVIGKPTNFSWTDCQAIFDLIERDYEIKDK
jgi:hypothetical protein